MIADRVPTFILSATYKCILIAYTNHTECHGYGSINTEKTNKIHPNPEQESMLCLYFVLLTWPHVALSDLS